MPIITEADADTSAPVLPQTTVPEPQQSQDSPGALEVASAALRQNNILSSVYNKYTLGGYSSYPAQAGYDPYANKEIAGYEDYASRFTGSQSPAQTQSIKNQIDSENADRQTLARAGGWGYAASLAAGATDPISLTAMLLPGIGEVAEGGKLAMIGRAVATNVAAGEAQAGALAANSQTGSYTQGILPRIGANALLAGVLGSIATRVPRPELDNLATRVGNEVNAPIVPPSQRRAPPQFIRLLLRMNRSPKAARSSQRASARSRRSRESSRTAKCPRPGSSRSN